MTTTRSQFDAGSLLSPFGLAAISLVFFLCSWLIPPGFYADAVGERNYLFLDPGALVFFILCFSAFIAGAWVVSAFFGVEFAMPAQVRPRVPAAVFLLAPLMAGVTLTVISLYLLIRENPDIIELIAAQQGWQIKENMDIHQPLGLASTWLLGILWWASARRRQLVLSGFFQRWLFRITMFVAGLCVICSALLKVSRGELMPVVAGTIVLYLLRRRAYLRLSTRALVRIGAFTGVAIVALFLAFSMLRGNADLLGEVVAYTVASYNRMAALLSGRLHFPYSGTGVYFSSFLSFNASLQTVFPIAKIMHWPDFSDLFESRFVATWNAGLNGYIVWAGTFGFLFSDFGWFTPVIVFFEGIVCGLSWRSLKLGRITGIVLYPWFAFCVLFWFGTNFFFDTKMVVLLLVALTFSIYEGLLVRSVGRQPQAPAFPVSMAPAGSR